MSFGSIKGVDVKEAQRRQADRTLAKQFHLFHFYHSYLHIHLYIFLLFFSSSATCAADFKQQTTDLDSDQTAPDVHGQHRTYAGQYINKFYRHSYHNKHDMLPFYHLPLTHSSSLIQMGSIMHLWICNTGMLQMWKQTLAEDTGSSFPVLLWPLSFIVVSVITTSSSLSPPIIVVLTIIVVIVILHVAFISPTASHPPPWSSDWLGTVRIQGPLGYKELWSLMLIYQHFWLVACPYLLQFMRVSPSSLIHVCKSLRLLI